MRGLKQSLVAAKTLQKTLQETGGTPGNGDPTQGTSRMGTARVKQEEEAEIRMMVIEYYEIWNNT